MKNSSNDFLLLKCCLQSLSKFSRYKPNDSIDKLIENLINKLKSSDNGFIHGAIGNYYLFNIMVCIYIFYLSYSSRTAKFVCLKKH